MELDYFVKLVADMRAAFKRWKEWGHIADRMEYERKAHFVDDVIDSHAGNPSYILKFPAHRSA